VGQVEAHLGSFGEMLILAKGARFTLNVPHPRKSSCAHLIELLGNMGQVEAHFGLFGDCVNLGAGYIHGLRRTYHRLGNHF
jgi:hypothetical protein